MKRINDPVEQLPAELLWEDDGHLSAIVITSLADSQDAIVPSLAHAHLDGCERCLGRVGEAMVLSLEAGEALGRLTDGALAGAAASRAFAPSAGKRGRTSMRAPRLAITAALGVAILGTIPFLLHLPDMLSAVAFFFTRGVPIVAHMLARFAVSAPVARAALYLPVAATLVLVMVGVLVAKAARSLPPSSAQVSEGGVSV